MPSRSWMTFTLYCAATYNVIWGTFVVFFPTVPFQWANMPMPNYPQLWQCIGMIVGVYGIGYAIAASDPIRHWPIVFVGLLGKIFGPIGFLHGALTGTLPWIAGWTILTNDLIWWMPFALILDAARRKTPLPTIANSNRSKSVAISRSHTGATLEELSQKHPLLVVFLRHFGCTFCREALAEIAAKRSKIEQNGTRIVLIHMNPSDDEAARFFQKYGLGDVERIADPEKVLYRDFGLKRGRVRQLFGFKVWWRGFIAAIVHKHSIGWAKTDSFQMPGVFLFDQGQIVQSFRHNSAADRPDYESLAQCEAANTRMKKDLDLAAQVQQALLPKSPPDIDGILFSWILDPSDELAGDTLDFIPLDDEHIGFYVLDVSGHGVSSALLTVTLHHWLSPGRRRASVFKQRVGKEKYKIATPAQVAAKLNQQFPQNLETGQYFTLIYGILNTRTLLFQYVTAGHPAPFHAKKDANPELLYTTGTPIGLLPNARYENNEIQLAPGDRVFLYSDGLTEMQNRQEEEYSEARVRAQIKQDSSLPLNQVLSNLVKNVRQWGKNASYSDDIAILSLEISAPSTQDDLKKSHHQTVVTGGDK